MTNWPVANPVATPLNAIQAEQVCGHAPTPVKQGGYMVVLGGSRGSVRGTLFVARKRRGVAMVVDLIVDSRARSHWLSLWS